jgi:hypothetical protein
VRRRRYTLLIDVESDQFRRGVRFWSEALGATARHSGDPKDPFIELPAAAGDVHIEMQRVDAAGRYHLDLYAPDVDVEARRLVGLGAKKVKREEAWWVMQAPTGHLFCVIPESAPAATDDDEDEEERPADVDADGPARDGAEDDEDDEDEFLDDDEDIDDDFEDEDDELGDDEDDLDDEEEADVEEERKYPRLRSVPRPKD